MTLSHATEKTPTIFDSVLNDLNSIINTKIQQAQTGVEFEQLEKEMHAAFVVAERIVMGEILAQYDLNVPFVMLDDKEYRQVVRCEQTYTSAAGQIRVERSLYRAKNETQSICPLELRAGIVEGSWSSTAAKQALLVVSQLTPYEAEQLFREIGGMQPSKSSLDRLPKKLNAEWEKNRELFEFQLRQQTKIPKDAVTVGVSLDGVLVPMQGGVVLLGDSRYEEASCGTVTVSEANLPIGSGIVEATCKSLVSQRLKRSGMCWKENGGQAILTFRALLQSELLDMAWEMLRKKYISDVELPKNVIPFPKKHRKNISE